MKTFKTILILLAIVALIAYGVVTVMEWEKEKQLQQSEIDGLKKSNKQEADRLRSELAITQDSLEVAFITIRNAKAESEKARQETQRLIKKYEKIIFVRYSNDHERDSVLSKLFPSFRPVR